MPDGFGRYDVYAVAGSLYCYPDSSVLRNHFGIKDSEQLRTIEADISAARQSELIERAVTGRFTSNHLCQIHRHLLGDIYPFAGNFRHEDIAKGATRFLAHNEIRTKLKALLKQLHSEGLLRGLEREALIDRSAYYMAELPEILIRILYQRDWVYNLKSFGESVISAAMERNTILLRGKSGGVSNMMC